MAGWRMSDMAGVRSDYTRTVVTVPTRSLARLKRIAAERHVSLAALIREAIEEKIEDCQPEPTFIGIADSGTGDLSRRSAEEIPEPPSWR
jgi:glutamate-1-semialdehyde aminotransferase